MTSDRKENRIPIRFSDSDAESDNPQTTTEEFAAADESAPEDAQSEMAEEAKSSRLPTGDLEETARLMAGDETAGPVFAELLATRAELKRVQAEVNEWKDKFTRRQADFENFRKRVERERSETYSRAVADLVAKLLPVLDNLRRALDTESSIEAN